MYNIYSNKLIRGAFYCLVSFALISSLLPLTPDCMGVQAQTNLVDIHVGVYNGLGADDDCTTALYSLLAWMGPTVTWVDHVSIHNGILNTLDLLAFPGGSPDTYTAMLGDVGIQRIQQFVENGGSYFGICGGGMFATRSLNLCEGYWVYPIPGISAGIQLAELNVNQASTGPDLSEEPATYEVLYWGSHYFLPTNSDDIIPVMSYAANDGVAMCVSHYGHGTSFICGPHPEFEEGSDRDGTTRYDYLDDPDSEWGLLEKVTQWLIDESPYSPPPNPFTGMEGIFIVVGITTIIAVVGVAAFVLWKRKRP
ncbi:MAG: BPL-N domain-containing protein, partial [Candidatus Thorarchaeota archaeon]